MVGQKRLKDSFSVYEGRSLPKTMLFIGEKGCGKHLFISELATKFNLKVVDVAKDAEACEQAEESKPKKKPASETNTTKDKYITEELLADYRLSVTPTLYIIDLSQFTEIGQNKFLKFVEEPTSNIFVALIAETQAQVISTILNRSLIYVFDSYTKEELKNICNIAFEDDLPYKICTTPGQLLEINEEQIKTLYSLCDVIIENIGHNLFANTLSLENKINTKNNFDKYNFSTFCKMLNLVAKEKYIEKGGDKYFGMYNYITTRYSEMLISIKTNKDIRSFVLNFIIGLSEEASKYETKRA